MGDRVFALAREMRGLRGAVVDLPQTVGRRLLSTVSLDGNVVTLRAEVKQQDSTEKDEKVLRSERYFGAVSRSFQLPVDIDQAQARAKYDNGVLTLTLPRKQTAGGVQHLTIE